MDDLPMAAGGDFVEMLATSGAGDGELDVASVGLYMVAGTGAGDVLMLILMLLSWGCL